MAMNNCKGVKELSVYLKEELDRIAQRANERIAQVITEAIQSLSAESDTVCAEVQIDIGDD